MPYHCAECWKRQKTEDMYTRSPCERDTYNSSSFLKIVANRLEIYFESEGARGKMNLTACDEFLYDNFFSFFSFIKIHRK